MLSKLILALLIASSLSVQLRTSVGATTKSTESVNYSILGRFGHQS